MGGMFKGAATSVNELVTRLATIGHYLTSEILPPLCCLCGLRTAPSYSGRPFEQPAYLCDGCRDALPRNRSREDYPPLFARATVPFSYAYPVHHCVRALKFRGERVYARVFGELLAHARSNAGTPLPAMVIPVPLHAARYRERGFNQAHEIARFAARGLGLVVNTRCLVRAVNTREQSGLSLLERTKNVQAAFALRAPLPATRVALVDDVLTTGNTVAEAARVLRDAGAQEIELWAIARVPPGQSDATDS